MTENNTLLGKWKLVKTGSDFLPGLENLTDGPLVLKLLGNSDIEFFKIEKKKYHDIEEVHLTYVTKNLSLSRSYQLCSLNIEQVNGNDVMLAIVKSCNEDFSEMTLCRLGPKTGQGSMESYKLDVGNGEIRLKVEVSTADGTRFNLIKYLTRFDDSGAIPLGNNEPVFTLGKYTMGWSFFDFWPSTMLSNATISIVKAIKVHSQDSKSNAKILETAWTLASFQGEAPIDFYAITRSMGGVLNDGEDVYMFVIKVIVGDSSWFVAHRYREFEEFYVIVNLTYCPLILILLRISDTEFCKIDDLIKRMSQEFFHLAQASSSYLAPIGHLCRLLQ